MIIGTYGYEQLSLGSAWSPGNYYWCPLADGEELDTSSIFEKKTPKEKATNRVYGQTAWSRGSVAVTLKGIPILGSFTEPVPDSHGSLRNVTYFGGHTYSNEVFVSGEMGWVGQASTNSRWGAHYVITGTVRSRDGKWCPVCTVFDQNGYVTAHIAYSSGAYNSFTTYGLGRLKSWWFSKESMLDAIDQAKALHYNFCANTTVSQNAPVKRVLAVTVVYPIQPPSDRDLDVMMNDAFSRGQAVLQDREGELITQVVNSYGVTQVDMIENLTQIKSLGDTFRSFLEPIIVSPKGLIKATAGRRLSYQYGDRLTAQDAKEVANGILSVFAKGVTKGDQTRRATYVTRDANTTVRVNLETIAERYDDALSRCFLALNDWGLLATPNTVWNLIPFSFCVDWFLNVEEYLSASKARTMMNLYAWKVCVTSAKVVTDYDRADGGHVHIETYTRTVSSQVPVPDVDWVGHWASLNQLVNGACLIAQAVIR